MGWTPTIPLGTYGPNGDLKLEYVEKYRAATSRVLSASRTRDSRDRARSMENASWSISILAKTY